MNPAGQMSPPVSILALIDAVGGPTRSLTNKKTPPFNPWSPRWLADGRHVVFASVSPGSLRSGHASLWVVDSESRELHEIHAGTFPAYPVLSPDGRDLYFADEAAKVAGIWHARTGRDWKVENAESLIPSAGGYSSDLTMSADGLRIAFSRQTGESAIWSIAVDSQGTATGEPSPLFRDRSFRNHSAHFSADGSKIAWNSVQADQMGVIFTLPEMPMVRRRLPSRQPIKTPAGLSGLEENWPWATKSSGTASGATGLRLFREGPNASIPLSI